VVRKYFVPNYQHRVTASAVALREFGAIGQGVHVAFLRSGAVTIELGLASAGAFAGQEIGFFANFTVAAGWHIYGEPLPEPYTPTSIVFDDPKIVRQSFELPGDALAALTVLGETLPVYSGSFRGTGSLLLKFPLDAGQIKLSGKARFQQCSDTICEPPETMPFELPIALGKFVVAH
jgi:thioredoxin:protein disulfide reductase